MVFLIVAVILAGFVLYEVYDRAQARKADRPDPRRDTTEYRAADEALGRAGSEYTKRVSAARDELRKAYHPEQIGIIKVAPVGDEATESVFTLHETSIQTPMGRHDVTTSTRADVDTAAGILDVTRAAVDRIGPGTVVRGPVGDLQRASDRDGAPEEIGSFYMLLQGDAWVDSAVCGAGQQRPVRAFAEQVNRAATEVDDIRLRRAERVEELERHVAEVTNDRRDLDHAEAAHGAVAR